MGNTIRNSECGHCGKSLSFYRKFFEDAFCNGAHKKAYTEKMNLLAVERLLELDGVLKAQRSPQ
jgi:hypothetical protein